jgi:hypothetical protein
MIRWVLFLVRRDVGPAAALWWREVQRYSKGSPGIIRELVSGRSVAADPLEVRQAVAWARAHPAWRDDDPPLVASEGLAER